MKIEIGESLVRSWLRHVVGCQLAELNWKISPEWRPSGLDQAQALMDAAREHFRRTVSEDLFRDVDVRQFLKQAEVDVLGVQLEDSGKVGALYCIDIAYHENGLRYGSKSETADRISKKLLRSLMLARAYFGDVHVHLVFVSPFVQNSFWERLKEAMDEVTSFLAVRDPKCTVRLIVNRQFVEDILIPVQKAAESVADTSELFLRSFQLLRLVEKFGPGVAPDAGEMSVEATESQMQGEVPETLPIELEPADVDSFKQGLMRSRRAEIVVYFQDGREERRPWVAENIQPSSNIVGNLRSRPEFRQGNWQRNGICRIKVKLAA